MIFNSLINPAHGGLPERGVIESTPTPLTLLQINSHVQKLACRCPRGFPIMANLFRKIIVHTLSVGDGEYDHLRHVTKFGTKILPKSLPAKLICITRRYASYLDFSRTYVNYW